MILSFLCFKLSTQTYDPIMNTIGLVIRENKPNIEDLRNRSKTKDDISQIGSKFPFILSICVATLICIIVLSMIYLKKTKQLIDDSSYFNGKRNPDLIPVPSKLFLISLPN
jgi:hypothetical protein